MSAHIFQIPPNYLSFDFDLFDIDISIYQFYQGILALPYGRLLTYKSCFVRRHHVLLFLRDWNVYSE